MNITAQNVPDTLTHAVSLCLEGMVFSEPLAIPPADDENFIPWEAIPHTTARISLENLGDLYIVLPNDLLNDLAEMLGSSRAHEIEISQIHEDTLTEILNQIAGEFMTGLMGEDKIYKLGLPSVFREPYDSGKYNPVLNFKVNEHRISTGFKLKETL